MDWQAICVMPSKHKLIQNLSLLISINSWVPGQNDEIQKFFASMGENHKPFENFSTVWKTGYINEINVT